jgi:hypothetical protein
MKAVDPKIFQLHITDSMCSELSLMGEKYNESEISIES